MKTILTFAAAAGMGAAASRNRLRLQPAIFCVFAPLLNSLSTRLYADTAPLFGPEGERAWVGKHWDPKFLHPQPAHDEEGAVFTVQRGPVNEVWVNTLFDVEGRHFHYVYFMADMLVTTVDVRFKPIDASKTQVNVVFTRTALTPAGNERVTAMSETDKSADKVWSQKIDSLSCGTQELALQHGEDNRNRLDSIPFFLGEPGAAAAILGSLLGAAVSLLSAYAKRRRDSTMHHPLHLIHPTPRTYPIQPN